MAHKLWVEVASGGAWPASGQSLPIGRASSTPRPALICPCGRLMTRQCVLEQFAFDDAPGAGTPVAEMLVFAPARFGFGTAVQRQRRRLTRQKSCLPQEHRRLAARYAGADPYCVPWVRDMHMLDCARTCAIALHLVDLQPAPEPGNHSLCPHELAFTISSATFNCDATSLLMLRTLVPIAAIGNGFRPLLASPARRRARNSRASTAELYIRRRQDFFTS